jgi:uncharacterized protein YjdB
MKQLRRVTLLVLALALLTTQMAFASSVLTRATEILSKMETNGNYASVSNDTNGSPSVGILQWNNARAVNLLKKIIADDEGTAKKLLGDALFTQLSGGTTSVWSKKTLSAAQRSAVGALLKTDSGVKRQNEQAHKDISSYIETAKALGIKDGNALVYYADIAHQAGTGAVKKYAVKAADIAGSYAKVTLKDMYQAAMVYATHTKSRRTKVYNLLVKDPVSGADQPAAASPTVNPTISPTAGPTASPTASPAASAPAPKSVAISPSKTQTLYLGDVLKLTASVKPAEATANLTWSSSNAKIASVKDGVVTPKKAGKITVAVKTQNGKKASVRIAVKPIKVKRVKISGENIMKRGDTQTLTAICTPQNATNQAVRWRSSNSRVAAVNAKGVVIARRKGKASIYCITRDGSRKTAKFNVRVG